MTELVQHGWQSDRPRGSRFDSWHYQILWVVVGLEWDPLSLVMINEPMLMAVGNCHADHMTPLYPQKLALKFAHQWRSLSHYSSLADQKSRSLFFIRWNELSFTVFPPSEKAENCKILQEACNPVCLVPTAKHKKWEVLSLFGQKDQILFRSHYYPS
jgi:hypothetical protein